MSVWTILQHDTCIELQNWRFYYNSSQQSKDFEAQLLTEIYNDLEIEPLLQPLEGEIINGLTSVNARSDVRARGCWREGQNAFFDVRITNTNSESQRHLTSEKIFTKQEREKKRQYNNRIMNIEHGTLTLLVFSVNGRMTKWCLIFYNLFLLERSQISLVVFMKKFFSIIKCKLSFLILRDSLMCVRGSRWFRNCIWLHASLRFSDLRLEKESLLWVIVK